MRKVLYYLMTLALVACDNTSSQYGQGGRNAAQFVKEQAPVITIGHGQFAVAKCQPVEDIAHHTVIVVHQGVGMPAFLSVESSLEEL